ncbi:MAG: CRISPR-associated protein Cas5 [Chthonomonadaceae bacterium]|nr:CRISPR-associated protein Cas5 [Chthonomonadaceae bacterium]
MESILRVLLDVPFWCSFRDPTGINAHTTFRLPPLTTLYGLVANALDLPQDDYSLRPHLRFAVAIERPGELVESYSKIMKVREAKTPEEAAKPGNIYISTSVIKQKLIRPAFWVYILANGIELQRLQKALHNPARPLYLGESDDVVDLTDIEIVDSVSVTTDRFDCAVPGVKEPQEGNTPASIVNLPFHFIRRGKSDWGLQRRLYTYQPDGKSLVLKKPETAYCVDGKHICFEPSMAEDGT